MGQRHKLVINLKHQGRIKGSEQANSLKGSRQRSSGVSQNIRPKCDPKSALSRHLKPWQGKIFPRRSVTRWLDYFSIFSHLQQWKLAQSCHKFAKVGSAFCQIRNTLSKICQRLVNYFAISGHTASRCCHWFCCQVLEI